MQTENRKKNIIFCLPARTRGDTTHAIRPYNERMNLSVERSCRCIRIHIFHFQLDSFVF